MQFSGRIWVVSTSFACPLVVTETKIATNAERKHKTPYSTELRIILFFTLFHLWQKNTVRLITKAWFQITLVNRSLVSNLLWMVAERSGLSAWWQEDQVPSFTVMAMKTQQMIVVSTAFRVQQCTTAPHPPKKKVTTAKHSQLMVKESWILII